MFKGLGSPLPFPVRGKTPESQARLDKMNAVAKYAKEAYSKKSMWEVIKQFGVWNVIDGNVAETTILHGAGAKLVGTDYNGNKYFEDTNQQIGRHRWIVYNDLYDLDPTSVPPEWHGWLHYLNDYKPTEHQFNFPIYNAAAVRTDTGKGTCYNPKGAWKNAEQRKWTKVQTWQP